MFQPQFQHREPEKQLHDALAIHLFKNIGQTQAG